MRGAAKLSRSQVPGGLRCLLLCSAFVVAPNSWGLLFPPLLNGAFAADGRAGHSEPVFHFRPGDDLVTPDLNWDLGKGFRIDLSLEFEGYRRSGRLTPVRLHGIDGRGKATTVALTFRDRGRLFFHILPSDIDAYVICDQTPPGSTPTWLRGEQHHISCGWAEDGQFKLYADHVKARAHRPTRDRQFLPTKITSVQITDEAGAVTECRIWLSGKGIGPREMRGPLPMKLVPFSEYTISPDVALPLPMQFAISDSEVFKSSFPRIVVECPKGIAPYRWMNIRYVFYGWFPYSWYRKDESVFREIERDGKSYMRYTR